MLSFVTSKVLVADWADNVPCALNLVDEECLIILKVLVAGSAIVMLRSGPLVTFELSFGLEVSVTVRESARDEVGRCSGIHAVGVVGVEGLCNGLGL